MNSISITQRRVQFGPPPAWADIEPFDPARSDWRGAAHGGVRYRLVDDQIRAGDGPQTALVRRITEILSTDGLNAASGVEAVFDPAWEQLCVHFVRVIRQGRARELPLEESFEVFRRERDLERAKFDGRLTAHMIIPDLRVGDVVDYCYSTRGEHPALGGLINHAPSFQWGVGVEKVRFRLMTPPSHTFKIRYWGPQPRFEQRRTGGLVDRVWTAEQVEPFLYEPGSPPEWTGHARAVMAQTRSWPQIADLFRHAYAPPAKLPQDLAQRVDEIARRYGRPADRVAAALRLVQGEVRYLAISMGAGGLLPREVEAIWQSRFGDCKDSSRLLAAILGRLGIEAAPALVNTVIGHGLHEYPPTTVAFDHCIVRVRLDGAAWWLDPTLSPQSGRLEALSQARFGWALPLVEGAELEAMGEDAPLMVHELKHEIRFGEAARSPARLDVRSTLRSWRADDLRRRLANDGRETVARAYREFYENRFGPLKVVSPLEVTDRPDDNEADTHEVYDLLEPWRLSEDRSLLCFTIVDEVVAPDFQLPRTPERRSPIHLGWPRRTTQETVLHLPRAWEVGAYDEVWTVGPAEVSARLWQDNARTLRLRSTVIVRGRSIPAADARAYFDMADRARAAASGTLNHTAVDGEFTGAPAALPERSPVWDDPRPSKARPPGGGGEPLLVHLGGHHAAGHPQRRVQPLALLAAAGVGG